MKKSSIFCLFSWCGGKKEKDIYIYIKEYDDLVSSLSCQFVVILCNTFNAWNWNSCLFIIIFFHKTIVLD